MPWRVLIVRPAARSLSALSKPDQRDALRGLRTLYVCASREGLAARPPVRPTRGGAADVVRRSAEHRLHLRTGASC